MPMKTAQLAKPVLETGVLTRVLETLVDRTPSAASRTNALAARVPKVSFQVLQQEVSEDEICPPQLNFLQWRVCARLDNHVLKTENADLVKFAWTLRVNLYVPRTSVVYPTNVATPTPERVDRYVGVMTTAEMAKFAKDLCAPSVVEVIPAVLIVNLVSTVNASVSLLLLTLQN